MRLHIDKELNEQVKYDAQKSITAKKQSLFDEELSASVSKPKKIEAPWNLLVCHPKSVVSNFNATDNNKSLTYDIKTMSKDFKDFSSNLAESF